MSSAKDEAKMEMQHLEGAWKAVKIEVGGKSVPAESVETLRYVFQADKVALWERDKKTGAGTVIVDSTKKPEAIDVAMTEGSEEGKTVLGIYEIAGNTMRMCLGPERPTKFSGAGKAALVELRREKPNQP
jgi:uncharacterized protein (TIGR03067 family)